MSKSGYLMHIKSRKAASWLTGSKLISGGNLPTYFPYKRDRFQLIHPAGKPGVSNSDTVICHPVIPELVFSLCSGSVSFEYLHFSLNLPTSTHTDTRKHLHTQTHTLTYSHVATSRGTGSAARESVVCLCVHFPVCAVVHIQ